MNHAALRLWEDGASIDSTLHPDTGATGETGRYTMDLLISQGFEIRALAHKVDERSEKL